MKLADKSAFPSVWDEGIMDLRNGLTIRQWYKAMAMMGMLSNHCCDWRDGNWEDYAIDASRLADAMIAEDEQHRKEGAK